MIIKINIEAESVEELQEALAGLSQKPVNFAAGAENTTTVTVRTDPEMLPAQEQAPAPAPEKPKRTRKAAAKAPESAQDAHREPETQQPEQVTPESEKPAEKPQDAPELGAPQYGDPAETPTIDQIAAAGAKLLDEDANKMSALLDLLGKYSVQAITQLKPEQLAGFAEDLRALGAEV